jgi:hypothetical protein
VDGSIRHFLGGEGSGLLPKGGSWTVMVPPPAKASSPLGEGIRRRISLEHFDATKSISIQQSVEIAPVLFAFSNENRKTGKPDLLVGQQVLPSGL